MCDDFFDDFEDGFENDGDWHEDDGLMEPGFDEQEPYDEDVNQSDHDTEGRFNGIDWYEMALFMAISEDIEKNRKKVKNDNRKRQKPHINNKFQQK